MDRRIILFISTIMGLFLFSALPCCRPPLQNIVAWYRANGLVVGQSNLYGNVDSSGNVLQWNDLSGNNNHAIQAVAANAPQLRSHESIGLNQRKCLNFNGETSVLDISNLALTKNITGFTMFAVCRSYGLRENGNVNEVIYFGTEDQDKGRCSLVIIYGATPSWMMRTRRLISEGPSFVTGSSDIESDTILAGVVNYASGYGAIFENGPKIDSDNSLVSIGATSNQNSADNTVGNLSASGLVYPLMGEVAEIICVGNSLSDSEIQNDATNYLRSFYGQPYIKTEYDPIVYAYLARCEQMPSPSFVTALNNFMSTCRIKGNIPRSMWCLKNTIAQQSLLDIIRPGRNALIPVGNPTYTPGVGYTMNGSSYLRTGVILSTDGVMTQNSITIGIKNITPGTDAGVDFGCFDGANYVKHYIKWSDNKSYFRINSATPNSILNPDPVGFSTLQRVNSTNNALYQGQVLLSDAPAVSNGLSSREIFIGAFNNNGPASEFSQGRTYDFGYMADGTIDVVEFETDAIALFLSQI